MTEQLTISRLGHRGDGVAETPEGAVYVPYTLPGESVTVDRVAGHPDRRHLLHVDKPSHERATPVCKHFGTCGGCAMQHWSLAEYHLWKRSLVAEALAQAGIVAPVADLIDAHGAGRRRAVFHARRGNSRRTGSRFHSPACASYRPDRRLPHSGARACRRLARRLGDRGEHSKAAGKPLDIQVTATDSGLDVDVRGSGAVDAERLAALAKVAEAHKLARLTRHGELVAQRAQPLLRIGRADVPLPRGRISPSDRRRRRNAGAPRVRARRQGPARRRSFHGHRHVCTSPGGNRARCGLRQRARRNQSAATGSRQSERPQARSMRRCAIFSGARSWRQNLRISTRWCSIRRGKAPKRRRANSAKVRYPSSLQCPATQIRLRAMPRILVNAGYKLASAVPVDQFRYSHHVEIVAKFTR